MAFAGRLANTMRGIQDALNQYQRNLNALAAAPGEHNRPAARGFLQQFGREVSGAGVGGYAIPEGADTIPWLPGAGGSSREGGIQVDFGPRIAAMNAYAASLMVAPAGRDAAAADAAVDSEPGPPSGRQDPGTAITGALGLLGDAPRTRRRSLIADDDTLGPRTSLLGF